MRFASGFSRHICALGLCAAAALHAHAASAQEFTESHLQAAHATINVLGATDAYDAILPAAAQALKAELIKRDPNLEAIISATVDETAITLAARRRDLEDEAARAYATSFTEEELKAITEFYQSPVGEKFQKEAPIVVRAVAQAAQIWRNGIARDLSQEVASKLEAVTGITKSEAPADGGGDAAQPAADQ